MRFIKAEITPALCGDIDLIRRDDVSQLLTARFSTSLQFMQFIRLHFDVFWK